MIASRSRAEDSSSAGSEFSMIAIFVGVSGFVQLGGVKTKSAKLSSAQADSVARVEASGHLPSAILFSVAVVRSVSKATALHVMCLPATTAESAS